MWSRILLPFKNRSLFVRFSIVTKDDFLKLNHRQLPITFIIEDKWVRYYLDEIIIKNYQINPSYLFAKVGYAQLCMHDDELDKIPEIFDKKYELKALYPERDFFHVQNL